jgi:hypothetical protein
MCIFFDPRFCFQLNLIEGIKGKKGDGKPFLAPGDKPYFAIQTRRGEREYQGFTGE